MNGAHCSLRMLSLPVEGFEGIDFGTYTSPWLHFVKDMFFSGKKSKSKRNPKMKNDFLARLDQVQYISSRRSILSIFLNSLLCLSTNPQPVREYFPFEWYIAGFGPRVAELPLDDIHLQSLGEGWHSVFFTKKADYLKRFMPWERSAKKGSEQAVKAQACPCTKNKTPADKLRPLTSWQVAPVVGPAQRFKV